MKKQIINLILVLLPIAGLFAQTSIVEDKSITSGYVKMEITKADGMDMLKGAITEMYFTPEKNMTEMDLMGGIAKMKTITNIKSKKLDIYVDAMGTKMWIDSSVDEAKQNRPAEQDMSKYEIVKDKSDTKTILGFETYKIKVIIPGKDNMKVEGYVTEAVKFNGGSVIQGMEDLDLPGLPLEFNISGAGVNMVFTAKELKETVDPTVFNINTAGYQKMSMADFGKSMGGMGMGF